MTGFRDTGTRLPRPRLSLRRTFLAHNGPQEGDNPWHVSPHAGPLRPGLLPREVQERRTPKRTILFFELPRNTFAAIGLASLG